MNIIIWIIAIILGVFGIITIFMNWYIFFRYIKKNISSSSFPFIGAISLCIAFTIIPNNSYAWLCWLAFIVDIGSIPGIVFTIISTMKRKHKK